MRNPERIYEFCRRFAKAWKDNCPDQRFGQFIMNVFHDWNKDPFYPEDDEMIDYIEKWAENHSPYHKPEEPKSDRRTCRDVMLHTFPKAELSQPLSGVCAAKVFGRQAINCNDWRDCEACWDQDAPEEYQEEEE